MCDRSSAIFVFSHIFADKSVDFSIRELDRVYHGGNACPFRRAVLNKMMKSEQVEILIVGGSVTNGGDLEDRLKWPLLLHVFVYLSLNLY